MTTLTEFRANVKDVARNNRFLLSLFGPITNVISLPENYQFLVTKVQIPKKDISGPVMKYRGSSIMLLGDYKKEQVGITFWNDIDWNVRDFFEGWIDYLSDTTQVNERQNLQDSRFGNSIVLKPLGPSLQELKRYTYQDIMPIDISEIELDQGAENTLQEFIVNFQYSFFERQDVEG